MTIIFDVQISFKGTPSRNFIQVTQINEMARLCLVNKLVLSDLVAPSHPSKYLLVRRLIVRITKYQTSPRMEINEAICLIIFL